jgi:hypothetical protein
MGHAYQLDEEVLWWREGTLEDSQKWPDVVQYHLDRHLPILLYPSCDDDYGRCNPVF